jgi:hypothetical protein
MDTKQLRYPITGPQLYRDFRWRSGGLVFTGNLLLPPGALANGMRANALFVYLKLSATAKV